MNNLNDNFLENEDIEGSEIIEETITEIFEDNVDEEQQNEVLSEAEKRIEQANLYQALLKHDLFAPGSARPEIIDAVRKEFKGFILSRLELLLGIKQEAPKQIVQQVQSPFTDAEVQAIKAIAARLVEKSAPQQASAPVAPVPAINTMAAAPQAQQVRPSVQSVGTTQNQAQRTVKTVVTKKIVKQGGQTVSEQVQEQAPQQQTAPKKNKGRKATGNVSAITGEELSQAAVEDNPALRPLAMPSQAQMDMMNAQQADRNARGGSPVQGEQSMSASHIAQVLPTFTK